MNEVVDYETRFRTESLLKGFDEEYVTRCLNYARPLLSKRLPIIYDKKHLSLLVGYKLSYINGVAQNPLLYYRLFTIKKRSGGLRNLAEPLPVLKEIQRWILDNILYKIQPSYFANGYIPDRSIKNNAQPHIQKKNVLSLDINNFFSNITFDKVYSFFIQIGYSKIVALCLTRLCTLQGSLPQGSPVSPALSNLISIDLDKCLGEFASENDLIYTRYADDMTFSGIIHTGILIRFVKEILYRSGLTLNEKKTRLMKPHQRQEVTGITVNKKLQASRAMRKKLRQNIYYIEKYGLDSHLIHIGNTRRNYIEHLMGIANFILFVNPEDYETYNLINILRKYEDFTE